MINRNDHEESVVAFPFLFVRMIYDRLLMFLVLTSSPSSHKLISP